jgi:hypothetical protein
MKRLFAIILLFCIFAGCNKEKHELVLGTVIQKGGCFQDSWLVSIDNADPSVHSFICEDPIPGGSSGFNCGNSVYIIKMSPNLTNPGIKVKFSKWKMDYGGACSSFSHAPHHLEDSDISAK